MNVIMIETELTAQEAVDLVGNWGRVIAVSPPAIPAGYEVRPVLWSGDDALPNAYEEPLWVLVPKGYPRIDRIYVGGTRARVTLDGENGGGVLLDDLNIPYRFATNIEEATSVLVADFTRGPEKYIFGF